MSLKGIVLALATGSLVASTAHAISFKDFGPHPLFDSAHAVALKGVIPNGTILVTKGASAATVEANVRQQLFYTVGQLNGLNGVADMNRVTVSVGDRADAANGEEKVSYAAELFIAWPKALDVPENYTLVLPAHGDYWSLENFYNTYGADEHGAKKCLANDAHEVADSILWYFYRPLKRGCPLAKDSTRDANDAVSCNMQLSKSDQNTTGKSPEYTQVWKDGRLVVTAIFGMADYENPSEYDQGLEAARSLYSDLQDTYGKATLLTKDADPELTLENKSVEATFVTANGTLEAHIFLVDGIRMVDEAFRKRYNELTRVSDFVSYSGHSGLGANIQALAQMGEFDPGQYQIYMINGCDTFAYVDNSLRDAHAVANPGTSKDKFFDVITNAMPSYFNMNSRSNMSVINALATKTGTYQQILSKFDINQRAVVTGEQDND